MMMRARGFRQTRTAFISSLLGIKQIVLAVNKLDLVDYSKHIKIPADLQALLHVEV